MNDSKYDAEEQNIASIEDELDDADDLFSGPIGESPSERGGGHSASSDLDHLVPLDEDNPFPDDGELFEHHAESQPADVQPSYPAYPAAGRSDIRDDEDKGGAKDEDSGLAADDLALLAADDVDGEADGEGAGYGDFTPKVLTAEALQKMLGGAARPDVAEDTTSGSDNADGPSASPAGVVIPPGPRYGAQLDDAAPGATMNPPASPYGPMGDLPTQSAQTSRYGVDMPAPSEMESGEDEEDAALEEPVKKTRQERRRERKLKKKEEELAKKAAKAEERKKKQEKAGEKKSKEERAAEKQRQQDQKEAERRRQERARRQKLRAPRSAVVLATFAILILLPVAFAIYFTIWPLLVLAIPGLVGLFGFMAGTKIVRLAMARRVNIEGAQEVAERELERVADAAGIEKVPVVLTDDTEVRAFALGKTLYISIGALELLDNASRRALLLRALLQAVNPYQAATTRVVAGVYALPLLACALGGPRGALVKIATPLWTPISTPLAKLSLITWADSVFDTMFAEIGDPRALAAVMRMIIVDEEEPQALDPAFSYISILPVLDSERALRAGTSSSNHRWSLLTAKAGNHEHRMGRPASLVSRSLSGYSIESNIALVPTLDIEIKPEPRRRIDRILPDQVPELIALKEAGESVDETMAPTASAEALTADTGVADRGVDIAIDEPAIGDSAEAGNEQADHKTAEIEPADHPIEDGEDRTPVEEAGVIGEGAGETESMSISPDLTGEAADDRQAPTTEQQLEPPSPSMVEATPEASAEDQAPDSDILADAREVSTDPIESFEPVVEQLSEEGYLDGLDVPTEDVAQEPASDEAEVIQVEKKSLWNRLFGRKERDLGDGPAVEVADSAGIDLSVDMEAALGREYGLEEEAGELDSPPGVSESDHPSADSGPEASPVEDEVVATVGITDDTLIADVEESAEAQATPEGEEETAGVDTSDEAEVIQVEKKSLWNRLFGRKERARNGVLGVDIAADLDEGAVLERDRSLEDGESDIHSTPEDSGPQEHSTVADESSNSAIDAVPAGPGVIDEAPIIEEAVGVSYGAVDDERAPLIEDQDAIEAVLAEAEEAPDLNIQATLARSEGEVFARLTSLDEQTEVDMDLAPDDQPVPVDDAELERAEIKVGLWGRLFGRGKTKSIPSAENTGDDVTPISEPGAPIDGGGEESWQVDIPGDYEGDVPEAVVSQDDSPVVEEREEVKVSEDSTFDASAEDSEETEDAPIIEEIIDISYGTVDDERAPLLDDYDAFGAALIEENEAPDLNIHTSLTRTEGEIFARMTPLDGQSEGNTHADQEAFVEVVDQGTPDERGDEAGTFNRLFGRGKKKNESDRDTITAENDIPPNLTTGASVEAGGEAETAGTAVNHGAVPPETRRSGDVSLGSGGSERAKPEEGRSEIEPPDVADDSPPAITGDLEADNLPKIADPKPIGAPRHRPVGDTVDLSETPATAHDRQPSAPFRGKENDIQHEWIDLEENEMEDFESVVAAGAGQPELVLDYGRWVEPHGATPIIISDQGETRDVSKSAVRGQGSKAISSGELPLTPPDLTRSSAMDMPQNSSPRNVEREEEGVVVRKGRGIKAPRRSAERPEVGHDAPPAAEKDQERTPDNNERWWIDPADSWTPDSENRPQEAPPTIPNNPRRALDETSDREGNPESDERLEREGKFRPGWLFREEVVEEEIDLPPDLDGR